jgi:iron complex outermembrane recepter protein
VRVFRLSWLVAALTGVALGQHVGLPTGDLDKLSPDELFNVQITSVGRKAQQIAKAPAAVFVLTAEDVRRSGTTCIPEALQWVPGLTVLHVDGRSWIVSARGGARLYANQMLVMIDGRSLYAPLFSGVVWDTIDVPIDDIERIEVVRGPGAVMWGPNAVNGVINIITKSSQATKGGQAAVAVGTELRNSTALRWGGSAGHRLSYRVWGEYEYRAPGVGSPGSILLDGLEPYPIADVNNLDMGSGSLGFRLDGQTGAKDQWMLLTDIYRADEQVPTLYQSTANTVTQVQQHSDFQGGSILGRWTHSNSPDRETVVQFSYSKADWNYPYVTGRIDNLTVDYQKRWKTSDRNEVYAGAGFQRYSDSTGGRFMTFSPLRSVYNDGDLVVRDEFQILPRVLTASAGLRVDYNNYSHVQYQPDFRLLYTPNTRHSAWIGVSRAVRTPSRENRDVTIYGGPMDFNGLPVRADIFGGGSALASEIERGAEAGYRVQSGQRWSVDVSVYWSYYKNLIALQSPMFPRLIQSETGFLFELPLTYDNSASGRSYGGEVWATWRVRAGWKLMPSYSYLDEIRWLPSSDQAFHSFDSHVHTVPHQFRLRSEHDLARDWRFDLMARATSRDPKWQIGGGLIVDARLAWRPIRCCELSTTLLDLTGRRTFESYPELHAVSIPLRRALVVRWIHRF